MKSARKLIEVSNFWRLFIVAVIFFTSFALLGLRNNAHAYNSTSETSSNAQSYSNSQEIDPNVPMNMHTGTQILMIEVLSALTCQLGGYDPLSTDHKCLGVDSRTGKIGFVQQGGGLVSVMGHLIDYTFVPPVSSAQYVAYMKDNFGITKSAYAQFSESDTNPCATDTVRGVGFCGLLPVLPIWVTMRNIVYLILILVFVVIGLGIMLRIHIDPRTVMTVQNQIPKIIIGIVAITFSFAIAGFLIDIMWVTTYLFAGVITGATNGAIDTTHMTAVIRAGNPIDAANSLPNSILDIARETSSALANLIQHAVIERGQDLGVFGDLAGGLINIIAFLVFLIAIVVALLRLWVSLIFAYINIILDVIFAPFWIIAGLLPGSSMGVGAWARDLIANLAVFPVAISFFLLADYLIDAFSRSGGPNEVTIVRSFVPPLMGGTDAKAVAALIGFGFILMLPNVMATVKAALKAPKINLGPIMGPIGVGGHIVGGTPKRIAGGVINEATRTRYENGHMVEPQGARRVIRVMRGGH